MPRRASAAAGGPDVDQVVAYDLAHAAAGVRAAEAAVAYGATGDDEARIACAFVADVLADLAARTVGREDAFGDHTRLARRRPSLRRHVPDSPQYLAALAGVEGTRGLDADFALVRETFHRFAEEQIRPRAEHIHRANADIPEEIITGLAEMGALGLSIPEEYGGFAVGGRERLHRHGGRHRGAVVGIARRRRFAHHAPRDPQPGAGGRGHRGTEAVMAAAPGRRAR